jgi:putative transposase
LKFSSHYSKKLLKQQGPLGNLWYLDEGFVSIGGKRQYLWRAVDQDGDTIDVMVQSRRNKRAALRFFRKLFKRQGSLPWKVMTDKLRSYSSALREMAPSLIHITRPSPTFSFIPWISEQFISTTKTFTISSAL